MRISSPLLCLVALSLNLPSVVAQSAATSPVGFLSDAIPANSDSTATAPLTRPSVFQGSIASISGNTITVTGTPNWQTAPAKQFQHVPATQPNTYYVQIADGNKAGLYATISDNTANSLTVQVNGNDNLSGIATEAVDGTGNGARITIIPFWTPATLFPATWPAGTQVHLFDDSVVGVNQSASQILVTNGSQWFDNETGQGASELLIHPQDSFVIRNMSASPLDRTVLGSVPMIRHRTVISTLAPNTPQDVHIAYQSPAPELIGNSSLGIASGDQLFVFDNAAPGQNKSASQILVFNGSQWFDNETGQNVSNTFSLQPGHGYVFRKAATATPQDFVWADNQSYNP